MTLAALLEELKQVDADTELEISDITLNLDAWSAPYEADIIQGCIQRAIVGRGWGFAICEKMADVSTPDNIYDSPLCDSPAEALLAAYITAVRGEAKR